MATQIQAEAEKEFKEKFSSVCQFVTETNKPDFLVMELPDNSKLNEKIRSYTSRANMQASVFKLIKPDFEAHEVSIAQTESAKLIIKEAEKEFKRKFSEVCMFAQKTNKPDFLSTSPQKN